MTGGLDGGRQIAAECKCHFFYIADSFGSVYGEQVASSPSSPSLRRLGAA